MENVNTSWSWDVPDEGRVNRSKKVKFSSIVHTENEISGQCFGSHGELYRVTLKDCSCVDFSKNKKMQPCKHMIALAMQCNILNNNGLTHDQDYDRVVEQLAIKVALAAGYYHVFDKPIISDVAYATLKYELWDMSSFIEEKDIDNCRAMVDYDATKELIDMPLKDFISKYVGMSEMTPDTFASYISNIHSDK